MKSIFASLSKISAVVLVVGIGIGINFAFANWSAPGDTPPGGNVQVPVNVGGTLQQKDGNLRAGGLHSLTSLRVDNGATIGTPIQQARLTIEGPNTADGGVSIHGVNKTSLRLWVGADDVATLGRTTNRHLNIAPNGNVGIGTTNPNTKLHIVGNEGVQIQRADNSGFANVYFRTGTDDNTRSSIGFVPAGGANDLVFRVGNLAERLRITSAGNVGIGTTAPTQKLHVNGNLRLTGHLFDSTNSSGQNSQVLTRTANGVVWQDVSGGGGGSTPNLQQVTDVDKSTTNDIRIAPSSGSLAGVTFGTGAGNNFIIGRPAGQNYFNLWDVSGNRDILRALPGGNGNLLLQPVNGNVGIGATPTEKLTVSGNIALASGDHRRISTSGIGNNLILGVNAVPNALTIQSGNGNVSIGPYAVAGRVLHVARAGSAVTINTVSSNGGGGSTLDLMTTWDAGGTGTPGSKGWALVARGDNYSPDQGDPSHPNDLVFGFWNSNQWMAEPMRLKPDGNLFIAGTLDQKSDFSLKTNIQNLSDSLAKILELRGVTFNWKNRVDEKESIGFIAQEVEQIFPELVKGEDGQKSVNYVSLVPVLVEAVKELDEKNKELEARLEKLEKRLGISF